MKRIFTIIALVAMALVAFTACEKQLIDDDGEVTTPNDVYEYVDLGLPSGLKWATCNVGAESPEDYGDYFAWGEVEPKEYYDWSTYKYCEGTSNTLTKYNHSENYGVVDNKEILDLEDDDARVNWGGSWRTPSHDEWYELRDYCTIEFVTINGIKGIKCTSKIEGYTDRSIFLPATGYMNKDSHLGIDGTNSFNEYGEYLTNTNYNNHQAGLYFSMQSSEDDCFRIVGLRYQLGCTVRPVSH